RVRVVLIRVGDPPTLEHVVEHDQTAGPDEPQRTLVVAVILRFVRVDEGEIERLDYRTLDPFKCTKRGADDDLDLFRNPGPLPVRAANIDPRYIDVASHDASLLGKRQRHGQCAVSRKGSEFERAPRPNQPREKPQEMALFRGDLHTRQLY